MDDNGTDIVWMCFERGDLFRGIVVVDSKLEVIRTTDNPVLARNEAPCPYRDICKLKRLDNGLGASLNYPAWMSNSFTCVSNDHILTCPEEPKLSVYCSLGPLNRDAVISIPLYSVVKI